MTSYRQDALRCVVHLEKLGPSRVRDIKSATGVDRVASILRDDVYGWFRREMRGIYALTDQGQQARSVYEVAIKGLF